MSHDFHKNQWGHKQGALGGVDVLLKEKRGRVLDGICGFLGSSPSSAGGWSDLEGFTSPSPCWFSALTGELIGRLDCYGLHASNILIL